MTIRAVYPSWPALNQRLIEAVAALTEVQLAIEPEPGRWPLWATIGHLACQRVSGLCGLAGEPGAETTPFPNALFNCPGDEDLETLYSAAELVAALESTFRIVEHCLDTWTPELLAEEIRREIDQVEWTGTRGAVIQRAFAHDISHCTELNESFGRAGIPQIDLWP